MASKLSLSPFSPPSSTLSRFNKIIATSSGTDKVFMLYAYSSHVMMYVLRSKRFSNKARLDLADRIGKLGSLVSDARVLYRLLGLFPIISWAQSLNDPASAPKDKQLALIQKLQCWSMLIYYPLEHYYYLAGKGIFKETPKRIGSIAIWSCRFWAAYVVLQVLHIRREYALLGKDRSALASLRRSKLLAEKVSSEDVSKEKAIMQHIQQKERSLVNDSLVQVGYLPLTMHWSLPNGLLPDQVWVGIFGTLAAACGLRGAWRNTA